MKPNLLSKAVGTLAVLAPLVLLTPLAALAADKCADATSQPDMNQCASEEFGREDLKLNQLYKQLVGMSEKAEVAQLKEAQRTWIKFRDQHCGFEAERYKGGTMMPLVHASCLTRLTKQRNETLRAVLKDFH